MKKTLIILLVLFSVFSLISCNQKVVQDDSPITMSVSLGNNQAYYEALKDAIKESLGYDVEFVYQNALDTTNAVRNELKAGDPQADIMITASKTSDEYLKNSCLDLISYTHLTDYFTYQKVSEFTTDEGSLYQLPFTSKLIGITYNKTLLEEMGWSVPSTYEDMLDLKKKCDENGIMFAVSAGVATGHGFNYLFHLMGAEWLSTLEGSQWFTNFQNGTEDITKFKNASSYFTKWVENGLFGKFHDTDWGASKEYCSRRALFYYDLTNSLTTYDGDVVDEDGNVIKHVTDEFSTIPWISENGDNNSYTYYDNMFLSLSKNLAATNQTERLNKCIKILEFMTTDEVIKIFNDSNKDGYASIKAFKADETRFYYADFDRISQGYIMPWYYSYFDNDSIMNTGALINNYLKDSSSSLDDIMNMLQTSRDNYLNQKVVHICDVNGTLSFKEVAHLNAEAAKIAYQEKLDELSIKETVDYALIPYLNDISDMHPYSQKGVVSVKAYDGEFVENDVLTIIPGKAEYMIGIHLQGTVLKELIKNGLTDEDKNYPYYVLGDDNIDDNTTYLVVMSKSSLNNGLYDEYLENSQIISTDGPLSVSIRNSLKSYLIEQGTISNILIDQK